VSNAPNGIGVSGRHPLIKGDFGVLRSWAKKLMQTKPFRLVAVALANKLACIGFVITRSRRARKSNDLLKKCSVFRIWTRRIIKLLVWIYQLRYPIDGVSE